MQYCKLCFNELTTDTVVMYRLTENTNYKIFSYCIECLNILKETQWSKYIHDLKNADCEKSFIALIKSKPPTHFRDSCIEDNKEIYDFLYKGEIYSAKLKGALKEEKREALYTQLLNVITSNDYLTNVKNILNTFGL